VKKPLMSVFTLDTPLAPSSSQKQGSRLPKNAHEVGQHHDFARFAKYLLYWIPAFAGMTRFFTISVMFVVASLAGCTPAPEPLRIVSSPWPGYEPIYLARDLGYLNAKQFVVSELPSANITFESFSNGSADIATITLDETLTLLSQGKKVRILAVMDISHGADAVMVKPHIKKLSDLKGKRIAITNIPLGVFMLSRTLEVAGLQAQDVSVIPMPEDTHEKAYLQNKIDAAVTFEPFKTKLAQAGAQVLFDSKKMPNEIFDLLVVSEETYQKRSKDLCELTQQWFRTLDHIKANIQESHAQMSKRLAMDPSLYQAMMDGLKVPDRQENISLLGGTQPTIIKPAEKLAQTMLSADLLATAAVPAAALAPEFLTSCLK